MANEQTSVPLYAALEVLTAANMNISAGTGVPVFATTVTRDAAFGGANEKTLAEGQLCYLSASNIVQYYDGAAWATVGPAAAAASGLTLISATTIGTTVSSVTVSSAFSSTYDNYKIIVSGGIASTSAVCAMTLGSTATGYYRFMVYGSYVSNTVNGEASANAASWSHAVANSANSLQGEIDLYLPNAAKTTHFIGRSTLSATTSNFFQIGGFLDNTTSYTAFTLTPSGGTLTGGTIRVYGYQNS